MASRICHRDGNGRGDGSWDLDGFGLVIGFEEAELGESLPHDRQRPLDRLPLEGSQVRDREAPAPPWPYRNMP